MTVNIFIFSPRMLHWDAVWGVFDDLFTRTESLVRNWVALVTVHISMSLHPVNLLQTASMRMCATVTGDYCFSCNGGKHGGKARVTEDRGAPPPPQRTAQIWTRWIYWMSGRDKSVCWVVIFNNNYQPWTHRCSTASEGPTGGWQSTLSHHLKTKDWLDLNLSHLHYTRTVQKLCCCIVRGLVNQIKPSMDCVLSETSNYMYSNFF